MFTAFEIKNKRFWLELERFIKNIHRLLFIGFDDFSGAFHDFAGEDADWVI